MHHVYVVLISKSGLPLARQHMMETTEGSFMWTITRFTGLSVHNAVANVQSW